MTHQQCCQSEVKDGSCSRRMALKGCSHTYFVAWEKPIRTGESLLSTNLPATSMSLSTNKSFDTFDAHHSHATRSYTPNPGEKRRVLCHSSVVFPKLRNSVEQLIAISTRDGICPFWRIIGSVIVGQSRALTHQVALKARPSIYLRHKASISLFGFSKCREENLGGFLWTV